MRKKIAATAIVAIAAIVATLLLAQPILSRDTASTPTDNANINAILGQIAGQGKASSSLNGVDTGQTVSAAAAIIEIRDTPGGSAVTTVKASDPWSGAEYTYWIRYTPDKANMKLDFLVIFVGNGKSVIPGEWISFDFNKFYPGTGYGGITSAPFSVTRWATDPQNGPAYLIVLADGVYKGYYAFTVTL